MSLPTSKKLPIHHLAAIFNNTTTSYKFYWFYAILQIVKQNRKEVTIPELIATMISSVWYSVHFYKLSFGKQDKLAETVLAISKSEHAILDIDKKEEANQIINLIIDFLKHYPKNVISKKIFTLGNYVPYRFILNYKFPKPLRWSFDF